MKKTVKMTCILRSGIKVEDSTKIDTKDKRAWAMLNTMRHDLESSLGQKELKVVNITFATTTIAVSEIAAISFKD